MPKLELKPQEQFFGLETVNLPENVKPVNTTDGRNGLISTEESCGSRPGMEKQNTTAKANPPLYALRYFEGGNGVAFDLYRDAAGNLVVY